MICGYVILKFHFNSLRHNTMSTLEFAQIAKQCFHSLVSWMLRCDQMQSLDLSFEF